MTVGIAASLANQFLDAFGNATNVTAPTQVWVKLHIGDPGAAGTANAATETTRKQASFGAASGGVLTSDADMAWTAVAATETYSHISYWTASTAGTFLGSDALNASAAVTAGNNFTLPAGSVTVTISAVAA